MIKSITIVDYGIGNLFSVRRALEVSSDKALKVSSQASEISASDFLILPGVGAFGNAMEALAEQDLIHPIAEHVKKGKPILGICLGMQLLASSSEEFGSHNGLNIIPGVVSKIPNKSIDEEPLKVPYIGWAKQQIRQCNKNYSFLTDFSEKCMYTIHSFEFRTKESNHLIAHYDYGGNKITSIVGRDNILGVQFHPEKSGKLGLLFLKKLIESGE
tara:strand:+ start:2972 stop:3616 length:645 start_codon:yes stop_codon:yes gene_type:complete